MRFPRRTPLSIDLDRVRRTINPPVRIRGFDHLQELINSSDCHSVVEGPFYDRIGGLLEEIDAAKVPGDLLVAGVWRGGSSAYLQALNLHLGLGKRLWLSDTFAGFAGASIQHAKDRQALLLFRDSLRFHVNFPSAADVERLFRACDVWRDNVTLLEGPLECGLTHPGITSLALIHLDVDFYEPTRAGLELTYPKLNPGGYVVIDDYGVGMFNCRDAVDEFREAHGICEPVCMMSDYIAYWRKERHV